MEIQQQITDNKLKSNITTKLRNEHHNHPNYLK